MQEYIDANEVPSLAGFCASIGRPRSYVNMIPELDDMRELLLTKKEAALERLGLSGEVNTTMAIFALKQLGWSDKVEHHHDGEVRQTYVLKLPEPLTKEEWEQKRLNEARQVGPKSKS